jgi:pilus assembly protein CpaC
MQGWRGKGVAVVLSAVLASSCAAHKPELSSRFREAMTEFEKIGAQAVTSDLEQQTISPEEEAAQRAARTSALKPGEPIWIQSGKSRIVTLQYPVRRVSIADPELASIMVLSPYSIMINAKFVTAAPGGAGPQGGGVSVQMGGFQGTSGVSATTLTPPPNVAETTITIWSGGQGPDVHTLTIADFINQQVQLEVTVAELDRTAMEEHGIDFRVLQNDFFAAGYLGGGGGLIPGQPFPTEPLLPLVYGTTSPTYAFVWPNDDVTVFLKILETEGLADVLAQPTLLAMSGQNAVFQSGGEIPIRIATGFTAAVQFKPFGTIVNFLPRVSEEGDITLTVTPELSQPDFTQEVEGVPTFKTRRASTTARLRNGQTLVVGGLLQTIRQESESGVPYLKDIPLLGYAFRSTTYSSQTNELIVIVKPRLVHPLPVGTQLPLPTDTGPMTREEARTKPSPANVTRPRLPGVP